MTRRFQFSLRALLIVTAAAALVAWSFHLRRRREEITRVRDRISELKETQRIFGSYPFPLDYQPEIDRLSKRMKELGGD
jgi:hypothetical protein